MSQGLGMCDPVTLAEQAGPVMAACTAMLEAEGTSLHLLAPLLGVVQQVWLRFMAWGSGPGPCVGLCGPVGARHWVAWDAVPEAACAGSEEGC